MSDRARPDRPGIDRQIQAVMNLVEEAGEGLIQDGVNPDAVVHGTLLAAMFLGSPLADLATLPQWLRDTAAKLEEGPRG